jgi:hypothetical protein
MISSKLSYAVEYPGGGHCEHTAEGLFEWCEQQFGPHDLINGRWEPLEYTIQFKYRKDRDWFLLRWAGQ